MHGPGGLTLSGMRVRWRPLLRFSGTWMSEHQGLFRATQAQRGLTLSGMRVRWLPLLRFSGTWMSELQGAFSSDPGPARPHPLGHESKMAPYYSGGAPFAG